MINILVVDDHEIVRFALRTLFEGKQESLQIVAETDNGKDAILLAQKHQPDIIIMDISLPQMDGIEATRHIRQSCPSTKIIVLTVHNRPRFLRELLGLGISGYVLKTQVVPDLFDAIHAALRNELYLSPTVAGTMANDYRQIISGQSDGHKETLSPRQKEVLQLIVNGKGTKEIALTLNISPKGVDSARHRMMQKLSIDNMADLTKYAIQEGITSLDY